MKKNARKTIVLANDQSLRRVDAFKVCGIQEIDVLITNLNSDHEELEAFRNLDLEII